MAKRKYKIAFAPAAVRQLRKLPTDDQKRILRAIETLEDDPRPAGVKKLQGADALWRIRIADYRVVYEIQDAKLVVLALRIAHRKDIYRKGK
ncbi:MAG: type II toxin-antitoxin system RelE/ParE family toxin [Planctomycetes bacterium]|nr:type II toxin-antitoxin system RelE/ParE family toxin [Planctomycetota bacterium]